jgi:NAD(P)-dependent dehydrogenase (short-subunit alcohol dehydrogenase family)
VLAGIRLARHYVPGMVARGWGRVVFTSSESGIEVPPDMVAYSVSKAAQLALARGIAESIKGTPVTVNAVIPGPTLTENTREFLRKKWDAGVEVTIDAAAQAEVAARRPTSLLQRMTTPEEVASLVVYLVSEQASGTTGAALRVDGGIIRSFI